MASPVPVLPVEKWSALMRSGEAPAGARVAREIMEEPEVASEEKRLRNLTMSTERADRARDTIALNGWRLDNFTKMEGPLLWCHDYSMPPIGLVLGAAVEPGVRLFATETIFTTEEENEFGAMVAGLYTHPRRFCRGLSIGMMPLKYAWNEERGGVDFLEQELLELSCCPVPMNADAYVGAKSAGIRVDLFLPYAEKRLDADPSAPAWMATAHASTVYRALSAPRVQVPQQAPLEASRLDRLERSLERLTRQLARPPAPPPAPPSPPPPPVPTSEAVARATAEYIRDRFTAITGKLS